MSDNYPVDPTELRDRGTRGIMSTGAGVGLMGINALLGIRPLGIAVGVGLVFFGLMGLFGKSRTDKVSGTVLLTAGAAGIATLFLSPLLRFVIGAGGLGLIGYGVYNIVKFVRGLKHRA